MEYETVSDSGVHVAGNFQGWDPATTMMTAENDSSTVYHYQFGSTPGTELQYKFVNGNTWDDAETVPADCATGGNRTHVVGETDFVADAICYNQCGTCTPPATAAVTFQADMSQLLSYGFDPSIHTLELRGPMNGWSGGDEFVVVTRTTCRTELHRITSRINTVFQRAFKTTSGNFQISASIGVASASESITTTDLLKNADIAMYSASNSERTTR